MLEVGGKVDALVTSAALLGSDQILFPWLVFFPGLKKALDQAQWVDHRNASVITVGAHSLCDHRTSKAGRDRSFLSLQCSTMDAG